MSKIIHAATAILVLGMLFGGSTVRAGIMVGAIAAISLCLLYSQLPELCQKFIRKTWVLWDIGVTVGITLIVPGTAATSVIGAVTAGIIISLLFHHHRNKSMS